MARRAVTKGKCYICKKELGKGSMKTHLLKCNNLGEGRTKYFMIKVEALYDKNYWLYIQVKDSATLSNIDSFLRRIWLECCGHLSRFIIDDVAYENNIEDFEFEFDSDFNHMEIKDMSKSKLKDLLSEGTVLEYEYDFGSTTTLKLEVVKGYSGITTVEKVTLLARNNIEKYICDDCDEKAEYIAIDYEDGDYTMLCEDCAEDEEDYEIFNITNSPRMGVCGYTGEQDIYELD